MLRNSTSRLIQRLDRMIWQKSSKKAQKGQGIVEYLLILVLTVAFVSALSRGVAQPLRDYLRTNVIGIVGCMLRVGKFPNEALGLCQKATLELNVQGAFGTGGSNNAGGSSSVEDSNANNDSDSSNSSSDEGSGNNEQSSGNRFRASSQSGGSGSVDEFSSEFSETGTQKIKIANADVAGGDKSFKASGLLDDSGSGVTTRKISREGRIGGSFLISEDDKVNELDENGALAGSTSKKTVPESLLDRKPKESSFAVPKEKKRNLSSTSGDTGLEFSFFGMMKWGFIIAILIMLAFFTFSQLNSIRKGMD